jgi:hypothetical protein
MGSLPGSAYGDITHRNQGNMERGGSEDIMVKEAVSDPYPQAIKPGKRQQQ